MHTQVPEGRLLRDEVTSEFKSNSRGKKKRAIQEDGVAETFNKHGMLCPIWPLKEEPSLFPSQK